MNTTTSTANKTLARIVARTWIDPTFKTQFLASPEEILRAEGVQVPADGKLSVLADTPAELNLVLSGKRAARSLAGEGDLYNILADAHNRALDDAAFRERVSADPAAAIGELGTTLPAGVAIHVHRESDTDRILVLPLPPNARIKVEARCDINASIGIDEGGPAPASLLLKGHPPVESVKVNINAAVNVTVAVNAVTVANAATTVDVTVGAAVAVAAVVVVIP